MAAAAQGAEVPDQCHDAREPFACAARMLRWGGCQPLGRHKFIQRAVASLRIEIDRLEHETWRDLLRNLGEQSGCALIVDH